MIYLILSVIMAGLTALFCLAFRWSRHGQLPPDRISFALSAVAVITAVIAAESMVNRDPLGIVDELASVSPLQWFTVLTVTLVLLGLALLTIGGYRRGWDRLITHWFWRLRRRARMWFRQFQAGRPLRKQKRQKYHKKVRNWSKHWIKRPVVWLLTNRTFRRRAAWAYLSVAGLPVVYVLVRAAVRAWTLFQNYYWDLAFWDLGMWPTPQDYPGALVTAKVALLVIGVVLLIALHLKWYEKTPRLSLHSLWVVPVAGIVAYAWLLYSDLAIWEQIPWHEHFWYLLGTQVVILLIVGGLLFQGFRWLRR